MKRGLHSFDVGVILILIYVMAYFALYSNRKPAANLAYWAYSEDKPQWVENCLYYGFFPVYFIHQRVFGIGRHTWDREEIHIPPDFQG